MGEHKLRDASRQKQGREGNTETASAPGPAMLIAGAGANKPEAAGPDAAAAATAAAAEKKRLEWCRREYVDAKDCDKWVANELGQGLKKADQERDREDAERDREDELRDAERDRAKTQGLPKQTDSQVKDTAKAVGLSGQGHLGDRLPMLCLASFSGILSIGMLAYFSRSALSQSRQRREAALLSDPAPV